MPLPECNYIIPKLFEKEDVQVVFSKVHGGTESFKSVVQHMGERRAWSSSAPTVDLDLNSTEDMCESKAYGPRGFEFGVFGTASAESQYIAEHNKHATLMEEQGLAAPPLIQLDIENDLLLKRQNSDGTWVDAEVGLPGCLLVSKAIFERWSAYSETENEQGREPNSLSTFQKEHSKPRITVKLNHDIVLSPDNSGIAPQGNTTAEFKNRLQEEKAKTISDSGAGVSKDEEDPGIAPRV
jgi:hypothetical protein